MSTKTSYSSFDKSITLYYGLLLLFGLSECSYPVEIARDLLYEIIPSLDVEFQTLSICPIIKAKISISVRAPFGVKLSKHNTKIVIDIPYTS